ncbi:TIGR00645 family protein [Cellulomonas palmilytica]|uniref:TIGR00645 family protein n=1 Tax=Cellulomonas palmilytica TaxID=2608402 RepID=UPI001F2DD34E|nr:TIGR00645 family protein [Cellulomonas palmilytica]UJP38707.1 TIGR00645 family protein [Cellulomonas palmilytica]
MAQATTTPTNPSGVETVQRSAVGTLIFASRWLQLPLYLGLIVAQAFYVWQFMQELWHLGVGLFTGEVEHVDGHGEVHVEAFTSGDMIIAVLGLVDVVMIANLLIMVIIGGYETFVSRIRLDDHPDQPEWLSHVNANVLKTKLAMSIIGISSIHLLASFIEAEATIEATGYQPLLWQTLIHLAFIVSAMALAWIDRISTKHPPKPVPSAPVVAHADADAS